MKRVGIALGGGGARGLAHIGILKVLEKENVPIHCIAGTSMGAMLGALYATNPKTDFVENTIRNLLKSPQMASMKLDIFREDRDVTRGKFISKTREFVKYGYLYFVEQTQKALLDLKKLEDIIDFMLPNIDISQTKMPFACVATDLTNGAEKTFTKGSLRKCVMASSSIAGIFPPVEIDGAYYNDGGYVNVTPITAVKMLGAELSVACDVKGRTMRWEEPEKAREIVSRSYFITAAILSKIQLKEADVVISPNIKQFHWFEFEKIDIMISEAQKAAIARILEIKSKASGENIFDRFKNILSFKGITNKLFSGK